MSVSPREAVTATSIADEIAFRLEAHILDGEYEPGSHLMQEELCARFGVSRTPVREALRKLQAQNLVELVPNKGARIRRITLAELREVYALRAELEGYAASLAAAAFSTEMVRSLGAAQTALEAVVATLALPDGERAADADINARVTQYNEEFHRLIRDAAGNALLAKMIVDLQRFFPKDYVWKAIESAEQARAINVTEHRRILRALRRNDAEAARAAMTAHIEHAGRVLIGHLQQRGVVA